MQWTLLSTLLVGCSWFGGSAVPSTPQLNMKTVPTELKTHEGKFVEVTGRYYAASSGDEWVRIIVKDPDGATDPLDCYTTEGPSFKGLARDAEITVKGRVEMFRSKMSLVECTRVVE